MLECKPPPSNGRVVKLESSSESTIPVKSEPCDIDLGTTNILLKNDDFPRPIKCRKVFMDAVVIPTLARVFRPPTARGESTEKDKIKKEIKKLCNVKKTRNFAMNADSVHLRISEIGYEMYPIDCPKEIQDITVTRQFISVHYGGNTQETFPSIGKSFLDKHGKNDFMFLNLVYNPHAPEIPGAPGLFFKTQGTQTEWPKVQRVISRIKQGNWQYQGQYALACSKSLTREEWCSQERNVQNTWTRHIYKKRWGGITCTRIRLRQRLRRDPTEEEVTNALSDKDLLAGITPEEIGRAFDKGEECLAIWTMKCVGYDTDFQRNLAQQLPNWVPPPSKSRKAKKGRHVSKLNPATPDQSSKSRGRKRQRQESSSESASDHDEQADNGDDDEEESDAEALVYRSRGTRSRPILL